MNKVWQQTGIKPKELEDLVELPKSMTFIWEVFNLLDYQRGSDFGTPQPIKFIDIQAYCNLSGHELESWEVELLIALDKLKLNQLYQDMQKEKKTTK